MMRRTGSIMGLALLAVLAACGGGEGAGGGAAGAGADTMNAAPIDTTARTKG